MSDVTRILHRIQHGDPSAADQLLPLVYSELKRLAAGKMAHESPDHTLQATALVHEAYLRLVGRNREQQWESGGHFFAAAAEAMRRILVDYARRKASQKRGKPVDGMEAEPVGRGSGGKVDLLALDEALKELEEQYPEKAQIVKLRFFAGLRLEEAAVATGISRATAQRRWAFARAWLFGQLNR